MQEEKNTTALSGYAAIVCLLISLITVFMGVLYNIPPFIIVGIIVSGIIIKDLTIINPNDSKVLILFGKYIGTIKKDGFFWVNPLAVRRKVSLKARNLNGHKMKVNDKLGNPIEIAAVTVWKVKDTAKALFEVDDYIQYVEVQSEAAVRHLANLFAYDSFEDEEASITLKDGAQQVSAMLEKELNERLERAGIDIIEARITHLAYAQEIASAMLQRQQATAIVAARRKIVDGAVGMVEMALEDLRLKEIIEFDEDKKAAMVSNLMVVLCSDRSPSPVLNVGTLHP